MLVFSKSGFDWKQCCSLTLLVRLPELCNCCTGAEFSGRLLQFRVASFDTHAIFLNCSVCYAVLFWVLCLDWIKHSPFLASFSPHVFLSKQTGIMCNVSHTYTQTVDVQCHTHTHTHTHTHWCEVYVYQTHSMGNHSLHSFFTSPTSEGQRKRSCTSCCMWKALTCVIPAASTSAAPTPAVTTATAASASTLTWTGVASVHVLIGSHPPNVFTFHGAPSDQSVDIIM